ncbi:unnamed protein product [Prorocentrum cordatum]|uniref:Uncharacterized protein n=1 Tax=Prorocentrum cordatum TaxID=2364126 RepID=A0ABN9VB71_9DINO|nr:unnamed protein product [Polarella glacialis]
MSAEALGAVGDHLELVAQLLRGQAAVRGEGDGAELGELLAALTRSSAALGAQRLRAPSRAPPAPSAPPAAAEQGLRAGAAAFFVLLPSAAAAAHRGRLPRGRRGR